MLGLAGTLASLLLLPQASELLIELSWENRAAGVPAAACYGMAPDAGVSGSAAVQ